MTNIKTKINPNNLPQHVAIIMDGNGRWAKKKNKLRIFGHQKGVKTVKEIVKASIEISIRYLTIYAFSKENWQRPKAEIEGLMSLLISAIDGELDELHENNVKINTIGDFLSLPDYVQKKISYAIEKTKNNTGLNLIIALSYGSRHEITEMTKQLAEKTLAGTIKPEEINQEIIQQHLMTATFPDPELLIRTSGEYRISNFLLWQIAYAELYFTDKLWPEFGREDFFEAIIDFQERERRFGKISEQINNG
ncbi:MAG: isoprenyl transferase [Candidatus Zixiibacteriota bacterium]|nr:MAG: isoprenyl transferase [candidate division Zixibacteria bacterium]